MKPTFSILTLLCVLMSIVCVDIAQAQRRFHLLGDFEYAVDIQDMYNTSSQPEFSFTGTYPQDYFRHGTIAFHWNAHVFGKYKNSSGVDILRSDQTWPSNSGFRGEPNYGMREVHRVRPPVTLLEKSDGAISVVSRRSVVSVDPTLPADMMIEMKFKSPPGIDALKRSYSFANGHHNDYVIQHNQYIVTFDSDENPGVDIGMDDTQTIENVYFVIGYMFTNIAGTNIEQTRWYSESRGDWTNYEVVPNPLVPSTRPLTIGYGYDGVHPDITTLDNGGAAFDNRGNPRHAIGIMPGATFMPSGEFISSNYAGFTLLHADTSPRNRADDLNQPRTILTGGNIKNVWDRKFEGFATWFDWAASGTKQRGQDQTGWPNNPGAVPGKLIFKAFGPYNLVKGDTVNIVFAVGAGGISRKVAEDKGKEWLSWYRGEPGATFDNAAKNALIDSSRDSLFQNLSRASWAWHNRLNVVNPLTSPDLTITEGANKINLSWTDLNSRFPDVAHYNIYRKRGTYFNDTDEEIESLMRLRSDGKLWPDGERRRWEKIATVPATQTEYEDVSVVRGEPYYYAVTVVDNGTRNAAGLIPGPLESSRYTNRSQTPATSFQPGEGSTSNILIVPNPYFASAGDFNFSDVTNKLLFVNLPPFCTIRIFTAMGDLVKTIYHTNGSADESWDQVTDFNQLVASGVYIMHVSNARDADQNPLPDAINKFVIVR